MANLVGVPSGEERSVSVNTARGGLGSIERQFR